jgi:uncharacterized membrane protein (UPF0182 family)
LAIAILMGLFVMQLLVHLVAEAFWFQELGYVNVYQIRIGSRFGLFALAALGSAAILFSNIHLAQRRNVISHREPSASIKPPPKQQSIRSESSRPQPHPRQPRPGADIPPQNGNGQSLPTVGSLRLWGLLPLTLILSGCLIFVVLYHGQIAIHHWHPHITDYEPSAPVPFSISFSASWALLNTLRQFPILVGVGAALSVAILFYPQVILRAIALIISVGFGVVIAEQWPRVLLALHAVSFDELDPLFQRDLSFYIFQLPMWRLLSFWAVGLSLVALLSTLLLYLLSGNSLSRGRFSGFTSIQCRHLFGLSSSFMGAIALMYWVKRYELLYSSRGVAYGASYTDVKVQLPVYTGLSLLAIVLSVVLFSSLLLRHTQSPSPIEAPSGKGRPQGAIQATRPESSFSSLPTIVERSSLPTSSNNPSSSISIKKQLVESTVRPTSVQSGAEQRLVPLGNGQGQRVVQSMGSPRPIARWALFSLISYWAIATVTSTVLPALIQRTVVQPNELQLETPFIERSIALTREALSLDTIDTETFVPQSSLTAADLQDNPLTIRNIRLWDARPLLETNRQLQRIRLYYEFPDADVDRYTIESASGETDLRQVLISARELNYSDLSEDAKTWVNEHLIYTHGYGFTMSPVNTAGNDGLPEYFISGIDHIAINDAVRRSIPVYKPRIYYGELTDTYVMTNTQVRELDFPSGDENEYNTYDGGGGISIAQFWQRLIFAYHLRDWRMLLNRDFMPDTRLLYRRNIKDRVQAIAPFLEFDGDPYLVVADITSDAPSSPAPGDEQTAETRDRLQETLAQTPPNSLYWIIDAYTTSSNFPYADPLDQDFNYMRNSVKVVIDAYNGTTAFYIADGSDPIIKSWQQTFPDVFLPLEAMPKPLQEHIRYPQDYYQAQSQHLLVYHMTDPQVFYNREDEWRAPTEIYANEQQVVEPYYLTMKLPVGTSEEFILFRPFTPIQRRNLIAWLAARSDGDRYGTQLLYTFPKQDLVFGPEQIEARINQDPIISQQISLWNREGSRAVQGNLLVIPIEQSLLYVEPLYLEAEQNSLPTLARVIVVFANQIAMAPTLEGALDAVFQADAKADAPPIVRPVDDIEALNTESLLSPSLNNGDVEPSSAPNEAEE